MTRNRTRKPSPLLCWRVSRVLQSYLDGQTDDLTTRRVREHLDECRRCGLEADTYRAVMNALARHEQPTDAALERLRAFGESLVSDDTGHDGACIGNN
jgi:anti-sigma factor RsiW